MRHKDEIFIEFNDPAVSLNKWQGSLRYHRVNGFFARFVSEIIDEKTDLKKPFDVENFSDMTINGDLSKKVVLLDLEPRGHSLSMSQSVFTSETKFLSKGIAIGFPHLFAGIEAKNNKFTINSPIIFSFFDQSTYKFNSTKRDYRFSIKDSRVKDVKFESKIFKSIIFAVSKESSSSADGDLAQIRYSATVTFSLRKMMGVWQIYRTSQLFEKLMFLLVGSHCGPMRVDVKSSVGKLNIYSLFFSSEFYRQTSVVNGLERCWTLKKRNINVGKLIDSAFADYSRIETPLELILDARLKTNPQDRFFRLVRALENIGRNFIPKGFEEKPSEMDEIQSRISDDPKLNSFFEKRVSPIFSRPNSLGYTLDFVKSFFPFWPITDIDKKDITRLRGMEAHARAHNFLYAEISSMIYYNEILDFICRACLLHHLGLNYEEIMSALYPHSRYSWFVREYDQG